MSIIYLAHAILKSWAPVEMDKWLPWYVFGLAMVENLPNVRIAINIVRLSRYAFKINYHTLS